MSNGLDKLKNWVNFEFEVKFDLEGQGQLPPKTIGILTKVFCFSGPNLVILAWTGDKLSCGQASDWYTHTHTHTDTGNDNTRRPKLASGKNCCDAFIQIRWVLFPIAMNRSSAYDPIYCPSISAKLRCFEIPCQVEKVACRACAWILDVTIPCFDLPNFQRELASAELFGLLS